MVSDYLNINIIKMYSILIHVSMLLLDVDHITKINVKSMHILSILLNEMYQKRRKKIMNICCKKNSWLTFDVDSI